MLPFFSQACGENPRRYGNRMDTMWALRSAFNQARMATKQQDAYCAKVEAGLWGSVDARFPESSEWELLVDALRGKVKVLHYRISFPSTDCSRCRAIAMRQ